MRWKPIVSAALLSSLVAASPAFAARINTLAYVSVPGSFSWTFEWDRTLPIANELWSAFGGPGVGPPAGDPWEPALVIGNFGGAGLFGDFAITAQNVIGPHVGVDVDPGDAYAFTLLDAFTLAGTGGAAVAIPGAAAVKIHTPDEDVYSLTYSQVGVAGLPIFVFKGDHDGFVVPEPSALALVTGGLLGLVAVRWRRRNRHGQD